jgi:hypothetical protein
MPSILNTRTSTLFQLRHPLIAFVLIFMLLALHGMRSADPSSSAAREQERVQTLKITPAGYTPHALLCREGETAVLTIVNTDARPHHLVIDKLDLHIPVLKPGESVTLPLAHAAKGTYLFHSDRLDPAGADYRGTLTIR